MNETQFDSKTETRPMGISGRLCEVAQGNALSRLTETLFVEISWLPGMDSNHDSRLQRPLSYH